MAIEVFYESAEAAPEEIRPFVKKDDTTGKFRASVVPSAKLDEFRDTNIAVRKENEALSKFRSSLLPLVGEDLTKFTEEFAKLQEIKKKVDNKEMVENSSFEEALKKRTEEMQRQYNDQIKKLGEDATLSKKGLEEVKSKYHSVLVDRHVTSAVIDPKNGALQEALPDLLSHARNVFKVDEKGDIVPVDADGNKLYGADGSSVLTPAEWLGQLRQSKPYFFKSSAGGGASGSQDARQFSTMNIENMSQAEYEKARKEGRLR